MTEFIKVEGVIIKKKDINDSDRLLTVFTNSLGKQNIIYKGINKSKKRDKNASDILSYSKFILYKKGENYIGSNIDLIENFENIKKDMEKIGISLYICFILIEVLRFGERNSKLYDLSLNSLKYINKETEKEKYYLLLVYYLYKILVEEGLNFNLEEGKYFSIKEAYFGKKLKEDSIFLNDFQVNIIQKIYYGKIKELLKEKLKVEDIKSVLELFENYFNYHLEENLNFKRYIWEEKE